MTLGAQPFHKMERGQHLLQKAYTSKAKGSTLFVESVYPFCGRGQPLLHSGLDYPYYATGGHSCSYEMNMSMSMRSRFRGWVFRGGYNAMEIQTFLLCLGHDQIIG